MGFRRAAHSGVCALRGALREALAAFLAVLDDYTLADLIEPGRPLRKLLSLEQRSGRTSA